MAFAALTVELPLFLPLAVATISGDSVAGEANLGHPALPAHGAGRPDPAAGGQVRRDRDLRRRRVALVALVGSVIGLALFGGGEMILFSGSTLSFGEAVGTAAAHVRRTWAAG